MGKEEERDECGIGFASCGELSKQADMGEVSPLLDGQSLQETRVLEQRREASAAPRPSPPKE